MTKESKPIPLVQPPKLMASYLDMHLPSIRAKARNGRRYIASFTIRIIETSKENYCIQQLLEHKRNCTLSVNLKHLSKESLANILSEIHLRRKLNSLSLKLRK